MGVRELSSAQQCKHTDKREPLEEWNACLGAQVGIRFHPTQLHHCSHDARGGWGGWVGGAFAFVAEESKTNYQTSTTKTGMDEVEKEEFGDV